MAKRMLIDATHPEETRVVVINGNRLEEFDFESSTKRQVKGNIYLAKITRVEPSLQAAFVEYGGNRHGFLAFSEIHPDYYRIPVGDRPDFGVDTQAGILARDFGDGADEAGVPIEKVLPEPVDVAVVGSDGDETGDIREAGEEEADGRESDRIGNDIAELTAADAAGDSFSDDPPSGVWSPPGVDFVSAPPQRQADIVDTGGHADRIGAERSEPEWSAFAPPPAPPLEPVASQPAEQPSAQAPVQPERLPPVIAPEQSASPQHETAVTEAEHSEPATATPHPAAAAATDESPREAAVVPAEPAPDEARSRHDVGELGVEHWSDPAEPHPVETEPGAPEVGTSAGDIPASAPEVLLEPATASALVATEPPLDPLPWAAAAAAGDETIFAPDDALSADDEAESLADAGARLGENGDAEAVEVIGGDEFDDAERQRPRMHRHYKIQEVIKRRQIMLVQVTKEERGNKGAALTTYLSLAGRYCVLMPNTARGGGVSRKITNLSDRRRLKDILEELDIPEGMGVIVRTAGAERSKAEIKRDYEYLLRLWNEIRDLTLRSTAPALIYEEGDLIKRSIRDLYTRDIDEVLVEGDDGYRTAKAFMKMLMPSHAKRVQPYRDPQIGLLHRFQVESQIDAIHSPIVQLRSGGYVVIDQTEALVAIDVNSGRATRERNIEETALRTNLEAAEEIARQLRLRDLAGLIVIDFIDMEEHRNQGAVERRLKEALKTDRARIQVGRISPFGLLEMSRQRLRPSLAEASTQPCPHCAGTGVIRSTESTALHVLRSIEEEGMRRRSAEVCVYVPTTVALYILNHKRESLAQLEARYGIHVLIARDDALIPPAFRLERLRALEPGEFSAPVAAPAPLSQVPEIDDDEADLDAEDFAEAEDGERADAEGDEERGRARRRRRRRRRHEDERPRAAAPLAEDEGAEEPAAEHAEAVSEPESEADADDEAARLRRRRGRRGGRRRGRREDGGGSAFDLGRPAADTIEIVVSSGGGSAPIEFPQTDALAAGAEELEPQFDAAGGVPAAADIETASLPALAGEALPPAAEAEPSIAEAPDPIASDQDQSEPAIAAAPTADESHIVVVPAPEEPKPVIAAAPAADEPHIAVEPAREQPEPAIAAPPLADDPDSGEQHPVAASAPAGEEREQGRSPAAPAADIRGNGAGEPEMADPDRAPAAADASETAAASEAPVPTPSPAPGDSGQIIREVTRKPENPRRGWWQRLIQP
jgi:ribonuclease E